MTAKVSSTKRKILLLAAIFILLSALLFAAAKMNNWFEKDTLPQLQVSQPGSSSGSENPDLVYGDKNTINRLISTLEKMLEENLGFMSWYQISVRGQAETSASSDLFLASDQIRYGLWILEKNQKKLFFEWKKDFEKHYLRQDLIIDSAISTETGESVSESGSWENSLTYARLLITAYDLWPDKDLWQQIEDLSDRLIKFFSPPGSLPLNFTAAIPTPAAVPDPAATPTPKPEISPTPEPMPTYQLTDLASIDLYALKLLIQVDPAWLEIYDENLSYVKNSYINDHIPLFARAIWPDHEGYLIFPGNQPEIETEASLTILLHLCEVGEAEERSIRWLSEQLFNNSALYTTYHAAQGHALSQEECITGYAAAARIARIIGDQPLYEKATTRLAWHIATNSRSEALGLVFRQENDEQIRVYARDNIWALLAMD